MTKTLTLDEMLDCIEILGDKELAKAFARQLESIGDDMRNHLATRLGVGSGTACREPSAFAGTCATFFPSFPGQPCPHPLTEFDVAEWELDEEDGGT